MDPHPPRAVVELQDVMSAETLPHRLVSLSFFDGYKRIWIAVFSPSRLISLRCSSICALS
jgi:hypothetical protein